MPSPIAIRRALITPKPIIAAPGGVASLPVSGAAARWHADSGITIATGVSQWTDLVASIAMLQATTGAQPAVAAAAYNGHNAVRFAGSQWLATASFVSALNPAALSLYITFKNNTKDFSDRYLFSSSGTNTGYGASGCNRNEQYDGWAWNGTSSPLEAHGGTPDATTLHLMAVIIGASGQVQLYIDNSEIDDEAVTLSPNTTLASVIGSLSTSAGTSGNNAKSDIGEIVLFPSAHTSTNLGLMHTYAQTEWGTP
jgi:hypothetical protein